MTRAPSLVGRALFWAAAPFVLPQGLGVRRRAPDVVGAGGEPIGVVGEGAPLALLAVGDSIMAGVGVDEMSRALPGAFAAHLAALTAREVRWRAHGEIGARARDIASRVVARDDETLPLDVALVSMGVNDVTGLTRTRAFADEARTLVSRLERRDGAPLVVLAGLPPLHRFPLLPEPLRAVLGHRARILDDVLRGVAASLPRALFVETPFEARANDFSDDGFHPNAGAVSAWAAHLARAVAPLVVAPGASP